MHPALDGLRGWYPEHCPYQLYFHHVRNVRGRTCSFGDADKCAKGSHAAPPGLALNTPKLDLDIAY